MIYKPEILSGIVNTQREYGRKTVFTNGCFDILHAGHIKYLKESKSLGDILIVGLNSDDSIRRLKGETRPINTLEDRATVIEALKCVDYVCSFDEDTPKALLEKIRPDILTKGGDYKKEDVVGFELLSSYGGEVRILSFVDGKSTTNIIERAK